MGGGGGSKVLPRREVDNMKLGFLTVALGNMSFEEKVLWAAAHGFSGLEVG